MSRGRETAAPGCHGLGRGSSSSPAALVHDEGRSRRCNRQCCACQRTCEDRLQRGGWKSERCRAERTALRVGLFRAGGRCAVSFLTAVGAKPVHGHGYMINFLGGQEEGDRAVPSSAQDARHHFSVRCSLHCEQKLVAVSKTETF